MMIASPNWKNFFKPEFFSRAFNSSELQALTKHANKEYVFWDKFRYYQTPKSFSIEQAWAYVKFSRSLNRELTPILSIKQEPFTYNLTKILYQQLSFIDSNTSGFLETSLEKPSNKQRDQLIISGLSEEAIASSQIEGANTSRKVAKEMILTQRKPRTKDELMIVNNFQVMQRLTEWKNLELSKDMLLEIQRIITRGTLDEKNDEGRFRTDSDDIKIVDTSSGEVVFTPPKEKMFLSELDNFIAFANGEDEEFIHPIIKATLLHFWLAYLHPFVDGNGRTARAIFYWFLLKKNYWLFQYLSVSRAIKKSRAQYDLAYIKSEVDENDLTYFLYYQLKTIHTAIDDFIKHYKNKIAEDKRDLLLSQKLSGFNERQISLINYLAKNPDSIIDIKTHQAKQQIAYQTARTDLLNLAKKNILTQLPENKKYVYLANSTIIKRILET